MRRAAPPAAVLVVALAAAALAAPQPVGRPATTVKVAPSGARLSIAGGGRFVAVLSQDASNWVLHDRVLGTSELVALSDDGEAANGSMIAQAPIGPAITPDGRFVAFATSATNLSSDDTDGGYQDVYVRDRLRDETLLASRNELNAGTDRIGNAFAPQISEDGRYVAFASTEQLLPGDNDFSFTDAFRKDLQTGELITVSVGTEEQQGLLWSEDPDISADGNLVVFWSSADNFAVGDMNGRPDIFVRDVGAGTTTLVSRASDGTFGGDASFAPAMSADGRFIAFSSAAQNLVPNYHKAGGKTGDVYLHDRLTGRTERVSVSSSGGEGDENAGIWGFNHSRAVNVSDDGRRVTFFSFSTNHVAGDANGALDVFVHDRALGLTELVSLADDGTQGDIGINWFDAEPAGREVAIQTSNPLTGEGSEMAAFVRDLGDAVGLFDEDVTTLSSGERRITGRASFAGAVLTSATQQPDGTEAPGSALVGAELVTRPGHGDLFVRVRFAAPPPNPVAVRFGFPGQVYGLRFTAGGAAWQVRGDSSGLLLLARCDANGVCTPAGTLSGGFGTTGSEMVAAIPRSLLAGVADGAPITGVSAFSGAGTIASGPLADLDTIALPNGTLTGATVEVEAAPEGGSAADATYTPAALTGDVFQATVPAEGDLFVRVCLATICRANPIAG